MTDKVTLNNPICARVLGVMSRHEPQSMRAWRRENLAGLSGRVLEIGAGTGTNFTLYPGTVTEVVAIEPEGRLAETALEAANSAPVPVTVIGRTIETFDTRESFDAVVCSLVLCSVDSPEMVLQQVFSLLQPGGELRYLEHVSSAGMQGRLQRLADATVWPRMFGNCHTHRDTERAITDAGFLTQTARRHRALPAWAPIPVAEMAMGRAVRPADQ